MVSFFKTEILRKFLKIVKMYFLGTQQKILLQNFGEGSPKARTQIFLLLELETSLPHGILFSDKVN